MLNKYWIDVRLDRPEYYSLVFVKLFNGLIKKCWMSTDSYGMGYVWTEYDSDLYYNDDEIIAWRTV